MITRFWIGKAAHARADVRGGGAAFLQSPAIATRSEVRADFPPEAASAARARRFVDATLRSWACDPLLDIATLLVSELVSNAVLHAGTVIHVVIRMNGELVRVEVHDANARNPIRKHYSSLATTGRGLLLVERMAHDWGVEHDTDGKHVWFELDESAPAAASAGVELTFDDTDFGDAHGFDTPLRFSTGRKGWRASLRAWPRLVPARV
jgi:anti-sigma regulatory factor (Ser/Thr protein kinase)